MPRSQGHERASHCPLLKPLSILDHYHLFIDSACHLFVARRTPVPFADARAIENCFASIAQELQGIQRQDYRLLVDTRFGPVRNDPAFEAVISEQRGKLLFGFSKNAALASMAVGKLQIQRYARADARVVFVTDEAEDAFEYLGTAYHELGPLGSASES